MLKFEEIDLDRMVEEVLAGKEIARETAAAILNCPDERLADLLAATRRRARGCLRATREDLHAAQRAERHLPRGLFVLLAIAHLEG